MRRAVAPRLLGLVVMTFALTIAPPRAMAQLCHDLPDLEAHHHPATHKHAHGAGQRSATSAASATTEASGASAAADGPRAEAHGLGLALGLRTEAATAAIERRPISYQGTSLRVDLHLRRFHLRAQGSWYRLRDTLETTYGPGDLMVAAMWTAVQRPRWRVGLALPVGAPLGDDQEHLGMGHWMVMPGVFAAAQLGRQLTASAGVAYHRALGNGHHNHGMGPYVNPMTAEELSFAGRAGVRAAPTLQLIAETAVAVPLDGDARAILGAGFTLQHGQMSVSVLAQAGALRAPFTARGVADLSYAF